MVYDIMDSVWSVKKNWK